MSSFSKTSKLKKQIPEPGNLLWNLQEKKTDVKVCWWHKGCPILSLLYLMSSCAGIIWDVLVRHKRSFDRAVTRLEFMAVGWRKDKDRHATSPCTSLLPLCTNINSGCLASELVVSVSKAWHMLGSVLLSYKMFLCHVSRWINIVLNVLNVPCAQWYSHAFFISFTYSVVGYYQNSERGLKILLRVPSWPSTFSHSSPHIS